MQYEGDNLNSIRRGNRAAVLLCLQRDGGASRKRLANLLGLTPAALTKIAAELIAEGLIRESGAVSGGGAGRREITLTLQPDARCALGVHLGLCNAILSAVRLDGTVLFSETVPLPLGAPADKTVASLADRLLALAEQNGLRRDTILGIGIAVRGVIGADGRTVESSFDALDTEHYPICDRMEACSGMPTVLSNNVRALFAAELFLDRNDAPDSLFFLRCGSGIGAAVSANGRILPGAHRLCSEIGHIPVIRRGGKPCHCGKSGCLETIASPAAIREDAQAILSPEATPLLWQLAQGDPHRVTTACVLDAARGGDAGAAAIVDRAAEALADALKAGIYLLDPSRIILYGEIFAHPYYLARLHADMRIGVDAAHTVPMERSPHGQLLEQAAAGLLMTVQFLENGGILA